MITQIFLDMDGVLCDFAGESLRLHNRPDIIDNWPKGEWDIAKMIGITDADFWEAIDLGGLDWWADLPAYPWARDLCEMCESFAPVCISTSPSQHHGSSAGKVLWLQRFFGTHFRAYMLGEHKSFLAQPGRVLVDDSDKNISSFVLAGGHAALVPQPWNSGQHGGDIVEQVRKRLVELDERCK